MHLEDAGQGKIFLAPLNVYNPYIYIKPIEFHITGDIPLIELGVFEPWLRSGSVLRWPQWCMTVAFSAALAVALKNSQKLWPKRAEFTGENQGDPGLIQESY